MGWYVLLAIAAATLFANRGGRNAVWGTATFGALIGVGIAMFQPSFDWRIIGKAAIIGTFIGLAFEKLPDLLNRFAR